MPARLLLLFIFLVSGIAGVCQTDSTALRLPPKDSLRTARISADTLVSGESVVVKKKHDPRKATIRSAILPGWGQAYNRKYWKIPVVYAALGGTALVFNFNRIQYNKLKYAYFYVINRNTADSNLFKLSNVDPELQGFAIAGDSYSLQTYRNQYRKNIDYSVLFFLFFWALNVVDATVDGHLKDFDVSNDLSMHIKPAINALPNTIGMSVVFTIGKHPQKAKPLPF